MSVQVGILGPLAVVRDGRAVPVSAGAASTVLSLLAVEPRAVTASELVEVVDHVGPTAGSRATVHSAVWRLRKVLGERAIHSDVDLGYVLNREVCTTDAATFEDLAARGHEERSAGNPAVGARLFEEALGLWRGPALGEFRAAPRLAAHAVRLEELRVAAREAWAEALMAAGDLRTATRVLRGVVTENGLREHAWALLVRAYHQADRDQDARATYDRARLELAEHGLEPGAELRSSLGLLPEPMARARAAPPDKRAGDALPPLVALALQAPLVGREDDLAALVDALGLDRDPGGLSIVWVSGPAGIGKTRLAAEVASIAHGHGARVSFEVADPNAGGPLGPVGNWVRGLIAELPEKRLREVRRGPLRALLHPGTTASKADKPEQQRWMLFEAVGAVLADVLDRPHLLVAEDVHRAGEDAVALLGHLLAHHPQLPLGIVATYRAGALDDRRAIALQSLKRRSRGSQELVVEGLTEEEMATMYAHLTGGQPDREKTRQLWRATGGNPALIRIVAVDRAGRPRVTTGGWAPQRLTDEVTERLLGELGDEVRRVLELAAAAAVVCPVLDDRLLSAAWVECDPALPLTVADGLKAAVRGGLLRQDAEGHWEFATELVRDAVNDQIPAGRRAGLHAALARALRRLPTSAPDQELGAIARHYHRAWPLFPAVETSALLRTAGEHAMSRSEFAQAAATFCDALEALALEPSPCHERARAELWLLCGRARSSAGNLEGARAAYGQASRLASEHSWIDIQAAAAVGALDACERPARAGNEDVALLRRAVAADDPLDNAGLAKALSGISVADPAGAAVVEAALERARRSGDAERLATVLQEVWWVAELERRRAVLEELCRVATDLGDPRSVAYASLFDWVTGVEEGSQGFDDPGGTLAAQVRAANDPLLTYSWRLWSANVAINRGEWDEALRHSQSALVVPFGTHDNAWARPVVAEVDYAAQVAMQLFLRYDLEALRDALGHLRPDVSFRGAVGLRCFRVAVAGLVGEPTAPRLCDELLDAGVLTGPKNTDWLASVALLAGGASYCGHPEAVDRCLEVLAPHADRHVLVGVVQYHGSVHQRLGMLHAARGDHRMAIDHFLAAVEAHRQVGARQWRVLSRYRLALAYRGHGTPADRARAQRLLTDVAVDAERYQMTGLSKALQRDRF